MKKQRLGEVWYLLKITQQGVAKLGVDLGLWAHSRVSDTPGCPLQGPQLRLYGYMSERSLQPSWTVAGPGVTLSSHCQTCGFSSVRRWEAGSRGAAGEGPVSGTVLS